MSTKNRSAFTLIELLIVVAIIAILAAIAVPNFLEAQTRSKVSKVYTDFRAIATALEAYRIDNPNYPPSTNNERGTGTGFIEPPNARLNPLTTPVAYISKVPGPSPFKPPTDADYWATFYQYSTFDGVLAIEDTVYLNTWYRILAGVPIRDNPTAGPPYFMEGPRWMIIDRGPDSLFFFHWALGWAPAPAAVGWQAACVFYDPTNGTVSAGDIIRSQMKSSFQ